MVFHDAMLVSAAVLTLAPLLGAGFFAGRMQRLVERLGFLRMVAASTLLCVPHVLVRVAFGQVPWAWTAFYAALPPLMLGALRWAARVDPEQRGTLADAAILAALGLAVDLRWLERAWPAHMAIFGKMLLLDAGVLGFGFVRALRGVGFDLRLTWDDVCTGAREFLLYAPVAVVLGLWLGFLHWHGAWPRLEAVLTAPLFTFFFIAIPEELFFRSWVQNLLERRLGRGMALGLTAALFGLSHFNKRTAHFNWRYVLLAALAGVFYGRAWRQDRRVGASAVTHTLVDSVWSLLLR